MKGLNEKKFIFFYLACPMWEASYTVGPQLYQRTLLPFFGTNTSFFLVKLLNNFKRHVSETSPLDQAGCVRFEVAMTATVFCRSSDTNNYTSSKPSRRDTFSLNTRDDGSYAAFSTSVQMTASSGGSSCALSTDNFTV